METKTIQNPSPEDLKKLIRKIFPGKQIKINKNGTCSVIADPTIYFKISKTFTDQGWVETVDCTVSYGRSCFEKNGLAFTYYEGTRSLDSYVPCACFYWGKF